MEGVAPERGVVGGGGWERPGSRERWCTLRQLECKNEPCRPGVQKRWSRALHGVAGMGLLRQEGVACQR